MNPSLLLKEHAHNHRAFITFLVDLRGLCDIDMYRLEGGKYKIEIKEWYEEKWRKLFALLGINKYTFNDHDKAFRFLNDLESRFRSGGKSFGE